MECRSPRTCLHQRFGERLFYEGQIFLFSGHKKAGKSWAMTVQAHDCIKASAKLRRLREVGRERHVAQVLARFLLTHSQQQQSLSE